MERWVVKIIALVIVNIIITTCTLLPIKVAATFYKKGRKGRKVLGIMACFGGGVFFGAYILHMGPEVRETIVHNLMEPNGIEYPLPELFMGLGFFLLMFIDKFLHIATRGSRAKSTKTSKVEPMEVQNDVPDIKPKLEDGVFNENALEAGEHNGEAYIHDDEAAGHSHQMVRSATDTLQSIMLLVALSIDSMFEGLSLGLAKDKAGVWKLMTAILSHEVVLAFTLGLNIYKYNSKGKTIILAICYGLMSPIGIAIGMAIYEASGYSGSTVDTVSGVLTGISAGVFIYCTFFQILVHEITYRSPLSYAVAAFLGFGLMCGLVAVPHGHDHHEECHHEDGPVPALVNATMMSITDVTTAAI